MRRAKSAPPNQENNECGSRSASRVVTSHRGVGYALAGLGTSRLPPPESGIAARLTTIGVFWEKGVVVMDRAAASVWSEVGFPEKSLWRLRMTGERLGTFGHLGEILAGRRDHCQLLQPVPARKWAGSCNTLSRPQALEDCTARQGNREQGRKWSHVLGGLPRA